MFNKLFNKAKMKEKEFNQILSFSHSVLQNYEESLKYKKNLAADTHPLIDVVRLLGRKLQTQYLIDLIYCEDETKLPSLKYSEVLFEIKEPITSDGKYFSELVKEIQQEKPLQLGRDLILPWPWKRSRLINCIKNIGEGRISGSWKQDKLNHYVELWLPMGVGWVNGGNHSIATGIIQSNGTVYPEYIYDISEVYEHVYTDGVNYYRKHNNTIISKVTNLEFAAIFEIGRIMKDKSISF